MLVCWPVMLLGIVGLVLPAPAMAAGGDPQALRVGRYSMLAPVPTRAQREPLRAVTRLVFPAQVHTLRQALTYALRESGYALAPDYAADPALRLLLPQRLPAVHRTLGPLPLAELLTTLAGPAYRLVSDPVHRLVSLEVVAPYRTLAALPAGDGGMEAVRPTGRLALVREPVPAAVAPVRAPAAAATAAPEPAPDADGQGQGSPAPVPAVSDRVPETLAAADPIPMAEAVPGRTLYGPVAPHETLAGIAARLHSDPEGSPEQKMLAILEANPQAFAATFGQPNVNRLRVGHTLEAPWTASIWRRTPEQARREVARQHALWRRHVRGHTRTAVRTSQDRSRAA